jgi:hypothetical protein
MSATAEEPNTEDWCPWWWPAPAGPEAEAAAAKAVGLTSGSRASVSISIAFSSENCSSSAWGTWEDRVRWHVAATTCMDPTLLILKLLQEGDELLLVGREDFSHISRLFRIGHKNLQHDALGRYPLVTPTHLKYMEGFKLNIGQLVPQHHHDDFEVVSAVQTR